MMNYILLYSNSIRVSRSVIKCICSFRKVYEIFVKCIKSLKGVCFLCKVYKIFVKCMLRKYCKMRSWVYKIFVRCIKSAKGVIRREVVCLTMF